MSDGAWISRTSFVDYFMLCLALRQRPADLRIQACTIRRYRIAYPAALETILRAKGAFFPNLEASGTLQGASFVRTLNPHAGFLDGYFGCHDGNDVQPEATRVLSLYMYATHSPDS